MNELIKLTPQTLNDTEVNTVNARELHEFLDVGRDFTTWIKGRLSTLGSVENEDYLLTKTGEQLPSGTKYRSDYYLSLDTAKHIAMMEKSDKGKLIREYFIECEKRLRSSESSENALLINIITANTKEEQALALGNYRNTIVLPLMEFKEQAQPKVTYYDLVLQSEDLMNISQIAKDFEITAQKLNKILHEEGIQYKDKSGVWLLYAKHLNNQYAQTVTHTYEVNGKTHTKLHLKWTQTGRLFIYELLKSKGILPVVEKEVK